MRIDLNEKQLTVVTKRADAIKRAQNEFKIAEQARAAAGEILDREQKAMNDLLALLLPDENNNFQFEGYAYGKDEKGMFINLVEASKEAENVKPPKKSDASETPKPIAEE